MVSCTALPFRVCTNCRSIAGASYFHTCYTHWEAAGRPCLLESCNATADEDLQQFFFRCKKCLRERDSVQQWRKLGQASLFAQKSLYSCGATINGNEPALQLLTVPSCAYPPLQPYKSSPEYLEPRHCRICHFSVDCDEYDNDGYGLSPTLRAHVKAEHGMEPGEYRKHVLGHTLKQWPQDVPAQVLRSRVVAYSQRLSDAHFKNGVCASCARSKRLISLVDVVFPSISMESLPAWLNKFGWSQELWQQKKVQWLEAVDSLLDVNRYLHSFFEVDKRIAEAEEELCVTSGGADTEFKSVGDAEAWVFRVKTWKSNLIAALHEDSVPSPGQHKSRWLLYVPSHRLKISAPEDAPDIECTLCRKC